MLELLHFVPFQRALLVGIAVAFACGLVGTLVVARREAILGHSFSNVAFLGVVLGLLIGVQPVVGAAALLVVGVLVLTGLLRRTVSTKDSVLEYTAQISMAAAIIGMQFFTGYPIDPMQYLFGDILAIGRQDVWISFGVLGIVLLCFLCLYKELVQSAIDTELAISRGLRLWKYDALFLLLMAGLTYVAMQIVGVILLSAFLVLPANVAKHWFRTFRSYLWGSGVIAVVSVVAGLFLSYAGNIPTGPTIVLVLGAFLLVSAVVPRR